MLLLGQKNTSTSQECVFDWIGLDWMHPEFVLEVFCHVCRLGVLSHAPSHRPFSSSCLAAFSCAHVGTLDMLSGPEQTWLLDGFLFNVCFQQGHVTHHLTLRTRAVGEQGLSPPGSPRRGPCPLDAHQLAF